MKMVVCAECGGTNVTVDVSHRWDPVEGCWVPIEDAWRWLVSDCADCQQTDLGTVEREMTPGEIVQAEMERVRREKADG